MKRNPLRLAQTGARTKCILGGPSRNFGIISLSVVISNGEGCCRRFGLYYSKLYNKTSV